MLIANVAEGFKQEAISGNSIRLMIAVSLLFFWTPVIGSFAAGFLGGRVSLRPAVALFSAVVSAIPLALILLLMRPYLAAIPIQGALIRTGAAVFLGSHIGALLIGAVAGSQRG